MVVTFLIEISWSRDHSGRGMTSYQELKWLVLTLLRFCMSTTSNFHDSWLFGMLHTGKVSCFLLVSIHVYELWDPGLSYFIRSNLRRFYKIRECHNFTGCVQKGSLWNFYHPPNCLQNKVSMQRYLLV